MAEKKYEPAYSNMVGGVLLIRKNAFIQVNGYSNCYPGWGIEDDDMYYRLKLTRQIRFARESERIGRYSSLPHPKIKGLDANAQFKKSRKHLIRMMKKELDFQNEGLNSLQFDILKREEREEWSLVRVELKEEMYERCDK